MVELLYGKFEKELSEFQEWTKLEPRLPKSIDKLLLLRFLKVYDFNLDKAKELLILNLEMRKNSPNIFKNRDISDATFQQAFRTYQIFPMPKSTSDNHKISIFRLVDTDPDKYVYIDVIRTVVSMLDTRFVTVDSNELIDGEIGIVDMSGFGWKHLMKAIANLSIIKIYLKYVQEAAPFKIVQNHFINCSPVTERFIAFLKPFMKKEIVESIQFHTNLETLFATFPRELLPNEFGGTAGNCSDFHSDWVKVVEGKRDYLLNDEHWRIDDK